MTIFICPNCEREYEDFEGEEQFECDEIREEGKCSKC